MCVCVDFLVCHLSMFMHFYLRNNFVLLIGMILVFWLCSKFITVLELILFSFFKFNCGFFDFSLTCFPSVNCS